MAEEEAVSDSDTERAKKIADTRDIFTKQLSDLTRQLSLAGIAIIWLLKAGGGNAAHVWFSRFLLVPLLLLTLSLGCDLYQYAYSSWFWDAEAQKGAASNLTREESLVIGRQARKLFWLKFWLCAAAMASLVGYIGAALVSGA